MDKILALLKDKKTWLGLLAAVIAAVVAWATGVFGGGTPAKPATTAPTTAEAPATPPAAPVDEKK